MSPNQDKFFQFQRQLFSVLADAYGGDVTLNELRVMNSVILADLGTGCLPGVTHISRCTGIPKTTVSRAVFNLMEKGMIIELPHPEDRRRKVIKLSDKANTIIPENVSLLLDGLLAAA